MLTLIKQLFHRHKWLTVRKMPATGIRVSLFYSQPRSVSAFIIFQMCCDCPDKVVRKRVFMTDGVISTKISLSWVPDGILSELGW